MFKFLKKTQAFTLIEMLLVLLIISLLLILIIPNIAKQTAHIQSTGCNAQVKMVNSQIEAYALKHNRNPSSIEDLIADGFINVKAFSLIEMLVAMMVISIILLIVPDLIRLSKTFLIESRELTTVDFEFFSRDILEDFKGVDKNDIEIRQQRIILHKGEEMIEYKLINNKIIKVVNDRGNITMINNVTAFTANIYYKSIIKITITVKVGTNLQTKTIYV